MREFNIQEVDLWYVLKKSYIEEDDTVSIVLYWNWKRWDRRKDCAKTYYFQDEAISSLILARKYWWNEPIY